MASLSKSTSKQRCKICNNLDYQGDQETNLFSDRRTLSLTFAELDHDCPLCRLVISSIESLVDKDCWNARIIAPVYGDLKADALSLKLVKDEPVTVHFIFAYKKPDPTRPDGFNTRGSSENEPSLLTVNFLIYSRDEVCLAQCVQEFCIDIN